MSDAVILDLDSRFPRHVGPAAGQRRVLSQTRNTNQVGADLGLLLGRKPNTVSRVFLALLFHYALRHHRCYRCRKSSIKRDFAFD